MKIIKLVLPIAIVNLISLILVTFTLPNTVPIHINTIGIVDGFSYKWVIPIFSIIPIVISIFYVFYSYYGESEINKKIEDMIIPLIAIFLIAVSWFPVFLAIYNTKSTSINIITFIGIGLAILFMVIGYFMGSIEPNKHLGIRTPWTLSNEIVWKKTHNLATYSTMVTGFILLIYSIAGIINQNTNYIWIGLAIALFLVAVLPVVYSYYEYMKLNRLN